MTDSSRFFVLFLMLVVQVWFSGQRATDSRQQTVDSRQQILVQQTTDSNTCLFWLGGFDSVDSGGQQSTGASSSRQTAVKNGSQMEGSETHQEVFESMELRPWTISGALAVPSITSFLKWTALMNIGRKIDGQQDGGGRWAA